MKSTRYRDLAPPVAVETSLLDTGEAEAAQSLARAFQHFNSTLLTVGGRMKANEGAQDGAAAALAGTFEPQRGFRAVTAYGQAYNNSGEAQFLSTAAVDIDKRLDDFELEYQGRPEDFEAAFAGFRKGTIEGSPVELRPRLATILDTRANAVHTRLRGQQIEEVRSQQKADFLSGVEARTRLAVKSSDDPSVDSDTIIAQTVADTNAQLDALVKDKVISPVEAVELRTRATKLISDAIEGSELAAHVANLMTLARGDVEAGDHALGELMARDDIDAPDKVAISEEYRKQRGLLEYERSRTHVTETTQLAQELAAGGYGADLEKQARRLYRLGAISPDEFSNVLEQSTRNERKAAEDGADVATVIASIQSGQGLDPANTKQRQALGKFFEQETSRLGESPGSDRWQAHAIELARATNILPESAASWMRINLLSGDPNRAAVAASFMARIADANPGAMPYNDDPRISAFGEQLNGNLAAGLDPKQAYALAHKRVYETTEEQKKILRESYGKLKADEGNVATLHDAIARDDHRGLFSRTPAAPMAAQLEFNDLVQSYFVATNGNLDSARKLAAQAIRRNWGVTTMNGAAEVVKYPPERLGLPPENIRADVAESLAPLGIDPTNVRLVPNSSTDRTQGQVWSLARRDEFGNDDVILGSDNRPLIYRLPLGAEFERTREALKRQKLEEARRSREQMRISADEQTRLEKQLDEYQRQHGVIR